MKHSIGLAIHGGAGTIDPTLMTKALEAQYRLGLKEAAQAGRKVLELGGPALDAVEIAVINLENNEMFNAGRGAVFTSQGSHELDASIMSGLDLMCGAVSGLSGIKNPISLARKVMEHSQHVYLAGEGALAFASEMGISFLPNEYFYTAQRWQQLQEAQAVNAVMLDHNHPKPIGTVGAVALDVQGNLAAATSTGGMTNKKFGRVGDTPIIGAGTYANNRTCAVSCTGHGEYFIRKVVAHSIHCRMLLANETLVLATGTLVDELKNMGGEGGLIAIDSLGQIAMPYNSGGMYRAWWSKGGETQTAIYAE